MQEFVIPETMKAMMLTAYDRLELATVPVPVPGAGEVLCRIKSVAICGSDPKMIHGGYRFANWPPYYPFIMGHEWAGQVVAVGEGVRDFVPGDRVAGEAHVGCGIMERTAMTADWIWDTAIMVSIGREPMQSIMCIKPAAYIRSRIMSAMMWLLCVTVPAWPFMVWNWPGSLPEAPVWCSVPAPSGCVP